MQQIVNFYETMLHILPQVIATTGVARTERSRGQGLITHLHSTAHSSKNWECEGRCWKKTIGKVKERKKKKKKVEGGERKRRKVCGIYKQRFTTIKHVFFYICMIFASTMRHNVLWIEWKPGHKCSELAVSAHGSSTENKRQKKKNHHFARKHLAWQQKHIKRWGISGGGERVDTPVAFRQGISNGDDEFNLPPSPLDSTENQAILLQLAQS